MTTPTDALIASDYVVCATLRKVADVFNVDLLWERGRSGQDGIALLDAIESDDPTALVGLPLIRVCRMLRAAGMVLP